MKKRPMSAKMRITKKVRSQTMRMKNKWIIICSNTQNYFWPSILQLLEDNRCNKEYKLTTTLSAKKIRVG